MLLNLKRPGRLNGPGLRSVTASSGPSAGARGPGRARAVARMRAIQQGLVLDAGRGDLAVVLTVPAPRPGGLPGRAEPGPGMELEAG